MKVLAFFPLAYLAGVHGFALFAPYMAFFLVVAHFARRLQRTRQVRVAPITVPVEAALERAAILSGR